MSSWKDLWTDVPPSEPQAYPTLSSETVGSKLTIIEFTVMRLTYQPTVENSIWWETSPINWAVLYWFRARIFGKGKDSRDFKRKKKKKEFQKPFMLFLKQLSCPFSLLNQRERKRPNQVELETWTVACGGGGHSHQSSGSNKTEKEFSLFLHPRMCCEQPLQREGRLRSHRVTTFMFKVIFFLHGCLRTTPLRTSKMTASWGGGGTGRREQPKVSGAALNAGKEEPAVQNHSGGVSPYSIA